MATTTHDIPMLIASTTASCERRITPSWTISQLKAKLEPVTGIPVSSQQLTLVLPDHRNVVIEAKDEDAVQIGTFELIAYAKINVGQCAVLLSVGTTCWNKLQFIGTPVKYIGSSLHLRERERRSVARTCAPTSLKVVSLNPAYGQVPRQEDVPKYTMPDEVYTKLPSTVLAYKKAHQIGRFDPAAPENQQKKLSAMWNEIEERGLSIGARARLAGDRHGTLRYIGNVPELGPGPWVGLELDEPSGKNDGSVKGGARYFQCEPSYGVFVRENRVEIGSFGNLGEEELLGSDMEEI